MPTFPKPKFQYAYDPAQEIQRLRGHKAHRQIPAKSAATLLLGTWNLCNFGAQERRRQDKQLYGEILSWFDLVAVQEVRENFGDLVDVVEMLGANYSVLMSDVLGNDERLAFVYDTNKVKILENVGHLALPPKEYPNVKLKGITRQFNGFDRAPYLATFQAGRLTLLLANVHQFFGSAKKIDVDRRALETFAVARWADQRQRSKFAFTRDVIALGDFNMPNTDDTDPISKALRSKGLELPLHSSEMGSNLNSDKHYDQVAFFPGATRADFTNGKGVFDFDKVVFSDLWQRSKKDFGTFVRYYLSDHRPLWVEFRV
jgi:endonuclease/exonuclease/phosphatase family metal-dependent hydrolase